MLLDAFARFLTQIIATISYLDGGAIGSASISRFLVKYSWHNIANFFSKTLLWTKYACSLKIGGNPISTLQIATFILWI